ncbi:MAG: outer membrane protein transport protein [Deltaproteobacteria bacterium]|nr:outer membrane protein transport protein [Deltaproteobacteria bacterium]
MKLKKTLTRLGAGALAALVPGTALGAGFQINEHNAAATARGGAVFATIDDASAVFYNPAGLANIKGTNIQAGITLIRPAGTYVGAGLPSTRPEGAGDSVEQSINQSFRPVPNAYLARALSDKAFVGFGFYAPYGLGITWDNDNDPNNIPDFVGRTVLHELELRTFFFTPAIALKLSDAVQVAVSVSLVPATVYLKRTLGASDNLEVLFPAAMYDGQEGTVELAGSAFGVGANAGVQVALLDQKLKFGLTFRSGVGLGFTGTADFELPETVPLTVQTKFPDGDVEAELTLPHAFSFGAAWDDKDFTVELGATLTLWQSYDELRIDFLKGLPQKSSGAPRDWTAVPTLRLGGEYRFLENYAARIGLAYDVTPVPDTTIDPTLPDNNRLIGTLGAGAKFGPANVDLSYMALLLGEREANDSVNFVDGKYASGMVHILAVTAGATFE